MAKKTLAGILSTETLDKNLKEPFFYEYKIIERFEDPVLQQAIISETMKAEETVQKLLKPWDYPDYQKNFPHSD